MAVLGNFLTYYENYIDLWADNIDSNQRQAILRQTVLLKLHGLYDLFNCAGRDGEYADALDYYEEMLTLLEVDEDDAAWDVGTNNLITFFGVAGTAASSEFEIATFANPLNLDADTSKDWICASVTGNTTINLNDSENGDSGMIKFTMDAVGGYTVALGTMFTERLGSTNLDVTANAINYVSWRNVNGYLTYTVDIATAV
jgi:tetratricopeptide (TPR) repeat protein